MERGGGRKRKSQSLRREFRELCKRKEEGRKEKLEEEVRNCRTEAQIWRIINKERKRVILSQENIKMGDWKNHSAFI